ncbi:MAG: hypothetical protein ABEJ31_10300 [Haloarculaceae archaeon]
MVEVTYHGPYCGAVTGVEREGYLHDESVTREPLEGWTYASTTDDIEDADGIEFVCLGAADAPADRSEAGGPNEPNPEKSGCGRTFYLNFVKYDEGRPVEHRRIEYDSPRFDFNA